MKSPSAPASGRGAEGDEIRNARGRGDASRSAATGMTAAPHAHTITSAAPRRWHDCCAAERASTRPAKTAPVDRGRLSRGCGGQQSPASAIPSSASPTLRTPTGVALSYPAEPFHRSSHRAASREPRAANLTPGHRALPLRPNLRLPPRARLRRPPSPPPARHLQLRRLLNDRPQHRPRLPALRRQVRLPHVRLIRRQDVLEIAEALHALRRRRR